MTEITLSINEEEIPLNPIMSKVLTNMALGFIDALKGVPEDMQSVKIEIDL